MTLLDQLDKYYPKWTLYNTGSNYTLDVFTPKTYHGKILQNLVNEAIEDYDLFKNHVCSLIMNSEEK